MKEMKGVGKEERKGRLLDQHTVLMRGKESTDFFFFSHHMKVYSLSWQGQHSCKNSSGHG